MTSSLPSLPEPSTPAGRAGLAALIADPARALIALDFDGTLAPIAERPEQVEVVPAAIAALRALSAVVSVCAIVSGRAALDVVRLVGDAGGLVVLGHYGLERWSAGEVTSPPPVPGVQVARDELPTLLADAPSGVYVEDKMHSLVLHTRPADDPAAALAALAPVLRALAARCGLEAVDGRYVLELRPPGVDKGVALRDLGAGRSAVLYAGDDLADLAAFAAVGDLRASGVPGVTVASSGDVEAPPELAARADLVVDGPHGVASLLAALATVLR